MKKEKEQKDGNEEQPQKGGKKKLLIPLIVIVAAALAAAVVFLLLPRFGINLLGGGEKKDSTPPKDELEVYTLGEETAAALDSVLKEGDGELIAVRKPDKKKEKKEDKKEDESGESSGSESVEDEDVDRYIYFYELNSPAEVVDRYLDVMLGGEQGFSLVDAEYVIQEDRPELEDASGSLVLARNSSEQEGHVFQVSVGWSEASANLAVRVSAPTGNVHKPAPKPKPEAASLDEHMNQLMAMDPAELGLSGSSMDEYEIYAMGGFVKVDDLDCRRFTIYSRDQPGTIAGIFLISSDKKHFFQLDQATGGVTELR